MLVVAVGVGVWAYFHFRDRVSSDDAQVDAHITSVASKIPGNVFEVLVNDNQPVKAGDVLVLSIRATTRRRWTLPTRHCCGAEPVAHGAVRGALTNETTQSGTCGAQPNWPMPWRNWSSPASYEQAARWVIAEAEANVRTRQANTNARRPISPA